MIYLYTSKTWREKINSYNQYSSADRIYDDLSKEIEDAEVYDEYNNDGSKTEIKERVQGLN